MNLPNLISLFRLFSTFFIIYLIFHGYFRGAFWLFCLAALSDCVDGFLARYFKSSSRLGAYLDPFADKVLLSSVLIALTVCGKIPTWLTFLAVLRDVLILVGIISLWLAQKSFEMKPVWMSKLNTVLQMGVVLVALYPDFPSPFIMEILFYGMALTILGSAAFYSRIWLFLMRDPSSFSPLQPTFSRKRLALASRSKKKERIEIKKHKETSCDGAIGGS